LGSQEPEVRRLKTQNNEETSQFRRAAISVPANIAEGFKKRTKVEKARFMEIVLGFLSSSKRLVECWMHTLLQF
jgi:four helix bundle protein